MNKKLIRKMLTAAGGPINYKRWDDAKITSYTIPFIKEKAIKLTNAGRATGAVLSTNLLDSLADNAIRAGVPIRTAIGISTKESTLGNPTDDRSAWNISSKIQKLFNGVYPGTVQHINNGTNLVNGINLINYHKGNIDHEMFNGAQGKSIIQEGLEFYKTHPNKYNPGLKGYQKAVDNRGKEVMNSPEVLKWYREWERSKAQIFRPEPYKINTNIQNTAQEFVSRNKQGGKILKGQNGLYFADNGYQQYKDFSKLSFYDKLKRRLNIAKALYNNGSLAKAGYALVGGYDPENPRLSTGDVPNPGMRDPKLIVSSVLTIDKFKNILKNYNPYVYRKPKLPEIKISDKIMDDIKNIKIDPNDLFTDNFIKYLEKQTGKKIKRIPYKNTKDGNIYKEGFSFVDENGKEIAHIAGNLKGKNVWVESSYVSPEFRHKGLGKLMYFDFNDNVYNTYGTTLHSSALQRIGYVDGGGMSPSNRLWKSLTDNKLATTEGSGFDWWNIMVDPSKIKTAYRKQGGKMNAIELFKNGRQIRKMLTASGGPITRYETLPNIEVVGYRPIELKTYKPLHKDYPFTGHSSLDIPIDEDNAYTQGWYSPYGISVDKTANSKDYNLITNNCADATLGALNYIFGTKEKPLLFTTPGDVRDYAINKLHGKVTRDKDGIDTILIPRNKNNAKKISKKALEWAKNKDENTIYEFEYKQGGKMNILEFLKKGSGIHIKKKNKGSFTRWCGGNVTDECILRGKNSSNPKIRKKATFADNARHFKHKSGGLIVQKFQEAGKLPNQQGGTVLPEITVVPTRLSLSTYYPIIGENYRYTGHSSLRARSPEYTIDTSEGFKTIPANSAIINKRSSDADYNFVTNNCADATRCALESITGKKMNPYFFTTPGDVLDFFKENFDDVRKVKSKNSGKEVYYTNITPKQLEMIKEQLLELILKNRKERHKELLANARHFKHKKGGKAFVEGVNVLDSNPKMSKAASRRVKKHLYGGDINNPNAMGGSAFTSWVNYLMRLPELLKLKEERKQLELLLEQLKLMERTEKLNSIMGTVSNLGYLALGKLLNNKSTSKVDNGTLATTNFWNTPTLKNAQVTGDFWNNPTIANSMV